MTGASDERLRQTRTMEEARAFDPCPRILLAFSVPHRPCSVDSVARIEDGLKKCSPAGRCQTFLCYLCLLESVKKCQREVPLSDW